MAQSEQSRSDRSVVAAAVVALISIAAYGTVIAIELNPGPSPVSPSIEGFLRAVATGSTAVWVVVHGVARVLMRIEASRDERYSNGYAVGYADGVARKSPDRSVLHSVN